MASLRSFAAADRFLAELATPNLRPGYVLAGDEAFLYQRCRNAVLAMLAPPELRDFCCTTSTSPRLLFSRSWTAPRLRL